MFSLGAMSERVQPVCKFVDMWTALQAPVLLSQRHVHAKVDVSTQAHVLLVSISPAVQVGAHLVLVVLS